MIEPSPCAFFRLGIEHASLIPAKLVEGSVGDGHLVLIPEVILGMAEPVLTGVHLFSHS